MLFKDYDAVHEFWYRLYRNKDRMAVDLLFDFAPTHQDWQTVTLITEQGNRHNFRYTFHQRYWITAGALAYWLVSNHRGETVDEVLWNNEFLNSDYGKHLTSAEGQGKS